MTTTELRFRLDMIRYLLRDLAADLSVANDHSETVTACILVADDEINMALANLRHIYDCITEVEEEDQP